MTIHGFTLTLEGISRLSDEDVERLFEAGCDDGSPACCEGIVEVAFDREAESFLAAVASAMRDVGKSGIAGSIARVTADDFADQPHADEINRMLDLLDRVERSDVHAWPVGHE